MTDKVRQNTIFLSRLLEQFHKCYHVANVDVYGFLLYRSQCLVGKWSGLGSNIDCHHNIYDRL